jgi:hypothetical protein
MEEARMTWHAPNENRYMSVSKDTTYVSSDALNVFVHT